MAPGTPVQGMEVQRTLEMLGHPLPVVVSRPAVILPATAAPRTHYLPSDLETLGGVSAHARGGDTSPSYLAGRGRAPWRRLRHEAGWCGMSETTSLAILAMDGRAGDFRLPLEGQV